MVTSVIVIPKIQIDMAELREAGIFLLQALSSLKYQQVLGTGLIPVSPHHTSFSFPLLLSLSCPSPSPSSLPLLLALALTLCLFETVQADFKLTAILLPQPPQLLARQV